MRISVIVCAYNEAEWLAGCLDSLCRQTRPADEIIVVNNASTDATREVAALYPGILIVDEPRKSLIVARHAGYLAASGDVLVYTDADCRAPEQWLARIAEAFGPTEGPAAASGPVAVTGPYRFYDWDLYGRVLVRIYDHTVAPATHVLAQRIFRMGAVLYGGNFAVRRSALEQIGGFDTSIEFHGEDTNLGRRLSKVGHVRLARRCHVSTSARRYRALGRTTVFRLYVRNFCSELFRHRPSDTTHKDIRI
ncbi:MAG TPA: glycosyltransferase family 2 protein [Vicinamibacterales bacterium]|jgi:glycosyltransferase involved in cell wall biosynthesis|nr:glycosyltransferase family 2 protein [Vicinamibacterales bacterium]